MRIGLFGGSFNPIHFGHLIIARAVAEQLDLAQVVLLPSRQPPHKSPGALADAAHRIAMVQRAIEGEALFSVSDFDVARSGPTYTLDTVTHFRGRLGEGAELCWIIGADSLADLAGWYRAEKLVAACRIVTAARTGSGEIDMKPLETILTPRQLDCVKADIVATPLIDISATDIRRRVAAGKSIRFLVPEPVREYIGQQRLYASEPERGLG